MSSQVLNLIANTINPSLLESSQLQIQRRRGSQGFATQLLIIADNTNNDIKIRQSAMIVLKNLVYDECNASGVMNLNDYAIVKGSILDALARQWNNKYLTSIIRQIIYLIAQKDYPNNWPDIVSTIVNNIENGNDFNTISSSVEALKAITSSCCKSIQNSITISNLCNKTIIALLNLSTKLFANFTIQTLPILVSIFKIFHLSIFYHLPVVIVNNIHSLMIFCKKILDISSKDMNQLKVICLKILVRIYSRHAGSNVPYNLIKFAQQFHGKYSKNMVETYVLLLIDQNNNIQICNLALNCLTCVYKLDQKSAELIDSHHQKILQVCLLRYKISNLKQGQSIGSFITHLKQQRNHFVDFVVAIFVSHEEILAELIEYLNKGDQSTQELVLYIFMSLSEQVQLLQKLHKSMSQFIINYILPILSGNSSYIMKARGCQIITSYKFVELPAQNLQTIFQFIYSCLTQSKQCYLNIYALQAFTQLICKYDNFMKLIIPYLKDILKVYTNLLKQSNGEVYEVIKSFQLFLGMLNGQDIQDCAVDLIKFLISLFYEYHDQNNNKQKNKNISQGQDQQESGQSQQQDQDPTNASYGCLACIRQIIATQNLDNSFYCAINDCILQIAVCILSDKNLLHFEQCLNILNLCLYKSKEVPNNFDQFFKIFIYAIVGIPKQLASVNSLSNQYKSILQNVCVNPDQDIVSNVIGFLKNFIAKSTHKLRQLTDQIGVSFIQYLFKTVQHVQGACNEKGQPKYSKSQRNVILTVYTSLLQYQFLNDNEVNLIINNLIGWYSSANTNSAKSQTNTYMQILLVCSYYNPKLTAEKLNTQQFLQQMIDRYSLFKYEYQLQRLLIWMCKVIQTKMLTNEQSATKLMKVIPDLVYRLINQRIRQSTGNTSKNNTEKQDQLDEQQAIQDLIAENTHLGTFPQQQDQRQRQKQAELNAIEEIQWDEEYNKYYFSPFCNINEIEYLTNVLKASPYVNLMTHDQQQKLTQYICNAPQKQSTN